MEIKTVCILGKEESGAKLVEFLNKADVKVFVADVDKHFDKQSVQADLVLEVGLEDITLKTRVAKKWDTKCHQKTIFAIVAANPWVTQIAAATSRPEMVAGLHLAKNPLEEKYLVQIVRGLQTSQEAMQSLEDMLKRAGLTVVRVEENPGLILDRVIASIVNEAALMYSTKLASLEDIDRMMRSCVNWPMGPFEFADSIGIDKIVDTLESMSGQLGPKYMTCFLLRKMVSAGRLGKKTGRGFYVYN
jgi:3-hydroxybutyryl-CoA dehydrogenase